MHASFLALLARFDLAFRLAGDPPRSLLPSAMPEAKPNLAGVRKRPAPTAPTPPVPLLNEIGIAAMAISTSGTIPQRVLSLV